MNAIVIATGLYTPVSEAYLEACQTSKIELFAKIVNDSILDV